MNHEQEQIPYDVIMSLGFKRIQGSDPVFYNQYGYDYVIIEKNVYPGISFSWDMTNRTAKLIRSNEEGDILGTILIDNLYELETLIRFFEREE